MNKIDVLAIVLTILNVFLGVYVSSIGGSVLAVNNGGLDEIIVFFMFMSIGHIPLYCIFR